jgi:purine-nucleoside phosphorylase
MAIVDEGAALLRARLGAPRLGLILGSGFPGVAEALDAGEGTACRAIPGWPARSRRADGVVVAAADIGGARAWAFSGRLHVYEGLDALAAAYPVSLLAAAGAETVVLTCAAGGLEDDDRPGDFSIVTDHLNLLGDDPIRHIPQELRAPRFLDLQRVYDVSLAAAWRSAARQARVPLRDGVLAAMPGPCYETAAEVRMLRALGADLASMSVVPEAILATYHRMRVVAIACIANRGGGLGRGEPIAHDGVVDVVDRAVRGCPSFFRAAMTAMLF